jgi:hypothetical protein
MVGVSAVVSDEGHSVAFHCEAVSQLPVPEAHLPAILPEMRVAPLDRRPQLAAGPAGEGHMRFDLLTRPRPGAWTVQDPPCDSSDGMVVRRFFRDALTLRNGRCP